MAVGENMGVKSSVNRVFKKDTDDKINECRVCKTMLQDKTKFKCDECELYVCAPYKKTYFTEEGFMCEACQ